MKELIEKFTFLQSPLSSGKSKLVHNKYRNINLRHYILVVRKMIMKYRIFASSHFRVQIPYQT